MVNVMMIQCECVQSTLQHHFNDWREGSRSRLVCICL